MTFFEKGKYVWLSISHENNITMKKSFMDFSTKFLNVKCHLFCGKIWPLKKYDALLTHWNRTMVYENRNPHIIIICL